MPKHSNKHYFPCGIGWYPNDGSSTDAPCGANREYHRNKRENVYPWIPHDIDCPGCLASEKFKQDQILFEIGYDGDTEVWLQYFLSRHSHTRH